MTSYRGAREAEQCDTEGMSADDAAEFRSLVASIVSRIDSPQFISKPLANEALTAAKLEKSLPLLRKLEQQVKAALSVDDVKAAVRTGLIVPGMKHADVSVEQVRSHAVVARALLGTDTQGRKASANRAILQVALTHPGKGDFILSLVKDRSIRDAEQIKALLEQESATSLQSGLL